MNSDNERRANSQGTGTNFIPDTHLPEQPITPTPASIAARDTIEKALPDLTGEARQYAQQQLRES